MRICIYGAGAMGTSLGAFLTESGVPCDLVSGNRAHVAALKENGADVTGAEKLRVAVSAILPEEMTGTYDIIFLAAKQRDNQKIAEALKRFLKEDGALVTVQNGLPEEGLAKIFGADRVYGCALSWGAVRTGAGCVSVTSESGRRFSLGAYGKGERLSEIAELLKETGEVQTGDLKELRYAKLAVNASFSTLSAITGMTFGELSHGGGAKIVLVLMRETFAVARAAGCGRLPLNGHDLMKVFRGAKAKWLLPFAMNQYKKTESGMLRDLQNGRRCEIDFIAGAVVREGEKRGVKTPWLARAVALVHDIENGFAEIAPESLRLLKEIE